MFFPTSNIQLKDIQGVGPGTNAIINCPKGPRYRRILLALQDAGLSNANAPSVASIIGELKVVLGSKVVRRITGAQLDLLNTFNGAQYASYGVAGGGNGLGITYLPIYFEEPWRKRADFQNGLACETGWLGTNDVFQIQLAIQGTTTTPIIGALACTDAYSSGKPNPIMKWYPIDVNTNAATLSMSNIFQGAPGTDLVESLNFLDPSDSVAQSKQVIKCRLQLNQQTIIDDQTNAQQIAFLKEADMNPGVGAYEVVFDHDDLFESLRLVSSISQSQVDLTLAAASAGTLRTVMVRLGDPTL